MASWLMAAFTRAAGKFRKANGGNVALIFAITLVPLLAATGAVVDYTRAAMVRSEMQDALDATALFMSKDSTTATMTADQRLASAKKFFLVNFTNTDVGTVTLTPSYNPAGPSVTVGGSTNVTPDFMGIVGVRNIPISATSTAVWGQKRLRVALVLDNTTSMNSSGKMAALKSATHTLLTQLKAAALLPEDVYVSIVPFVEDVKVDPTNYNQSWIQFDDPACTATPSGANCDSWWDGFNGTCSKSGSSKRSACVSTGTCNISGKSSKSTCQSASGCYVNSSYTTSYTTSSTCTAVGTCSVSSRTTQSSCTTASCSVSGRSTQAACIAAGTCSISTYTTQSTCTAAGTCSKSQYTTSGTCNSNRGTWTAARWTSQTAGTWTAAGTWTQTGFWSAGTWTVATWTPYPHNTGSHAWDGCVTDRGSWTAPGTTAGDDQQIYSTDHPSAFPADQTSYCPQTMVGLTNDWDTLSDTVDDMSPNGYTNQPIGLVWGWQSLIGDAGLTVPAYDTRYQYREVVILLSDGVNTQDRWYTAPDPNTDEPHVDGRMQNGTGSNISGTCANVKAAGIDIYSVQVDTDGSGLSTLLQNCASTPQQFFRLTSSSQIVTTFQTIGTALSELRLSM